MPGTPGPALKTMLFSLLALAGAVLAGPPASAQSYLGCYLDMGDPSGTDGRDMSGVLHILENNSVALCSKTCRNDGYEYAGVQYGTACFCDHSYGSFGPATNCDMPCPGNPAQTCGGSWANAVYTTTTGIPATERGYLGCYHDKGDPEGTTGRDLSGRITVLDDMTVELCVLQCAGSFEFAAVQFGSYCFCGNSYGAYGRIDTGCKMPCPGNPTQTCGGAWENSVYTTRGFIGR